jgi:type I restriction enzyme M protein
MPEGIKAYSKTKTIQLPEFDPIKKWWKKREESELSWKVNIKDVVARGYDLDIKNPNKQEEVHEYSSKELMDLLDASFDRGHKLLESIRNSVK